ncbi:MAG TPA: alpha/beta fold hydrolase [Solirubrobacteraceae bacterium]|nr:alpha/beta fold hydrolase [Solirubrobacteraceae bacterium]
MDRDAAILLLHGFSTTSRAWSRVRAAGLDASARVLAPDLRGHGRAGAVRPVDLAGVLDDLAALTPGPCVLGGYSQGGRIALHAALDPRIGPRLSRLVLIGASPGLADPAERAARRVSDEALARELEQGSIQAFAHRWAETPVLAGLVPELAAEAHADRLHNSPAGLAAALRGLGTGALPSLWERLDQLTLPVTLLAGERDTKFTHLAEEMARALPRAEVVIVPGAGHQVHLEAPAVVAAALLSG